MKVAVLGAGGMGRTVIGHLQKCPGVTGIVAYDVSKEQLEQAGPDVVTTCDLNEVLADSAVRLVFVTSSTNAHKSLTVQSLQAGKAVLCEKPMATTLDEAREMVEAAERAEGFLQIGFELRYSKLYTRVAEWIEAGLLGEVVNTQCTYIASAWPKNSWRTGAQSGGMFGEKLSHYVDLPRWWIDAPVGEVYAVCAPNVLPYLQVHDNYHATYRFQNGAVSELTFMMGPAASFAGDPLQDMIGQQKDDGHVLRYLVVGTKGAAQTDVFRRSIKRWQFGDAPEYSTSELVEEMTWPPDEDQFYFHNTFDQTRDVVRRVVQGLPPRFPIRDAYETTRLCFAAEASAESGKPVKLEGFPQ